ncbi:MAG: hypothetical protein C4539_00765 [Ignavibacteriales bacterium]|nr:MAG: hypothetical protein C4539_00765 [Ignavibacteriales bacterium]
MHSFSFPFVIKSKLHHNCDDKFASWLIYRLNLDSRRIKFWIQYNKKNFLICGLQLKRCKKVRIIHFSMDIVEGE